ncbi:MAG: ABC transporter permease [Clostridiaceae bacterium]|nr:ABC transporter permease [Clostridiaceae bacterium]
MTSFWLSILEQGLIFAIMSLGVYITYKILDFPDLSVDGSFPLGAAVTATLLVMGINPFLACLLSMFAGMISGGITGLLHVKLKITNLLSGILVMIGLYSINLRIMGRANIPLFTQETIFSNSLPPVLIVAIFVFVAKLLLDLFFKTKLGFLLRATGDNPQMVTSLGIDIGMMKIMGLMLSNGLVALSGSMMAQYQRFSDVGMGTGMIIMGLAAIILGEALLKRFSFVTATSMALFGTILYRTTIASALRLGLPPSDLKLITSIIVITALGINGKKLPFNLNLKSLIKIGGVHNVTGAKSSKSFQ